MQRRFDVAKLRSIPILEVFRMLGEVPLRQSGKVVTFKGSDGLRAYPYTNSYYCFAGKRGAGDVISLVVNYLKTDFVGACQWLADTFNMWEYSSNDKKSYQPRSKRAYKPALNIESNPQAYGESLAGLRGEFGSPQAITYYPAAILKATQKGYESNSFVQACQNVIPDVSHEDLQRVIELYQIGTVLNNKLWSGAATFPAIDREGRCHTIQIKQFTADLHTAKWDDGSQKVSFIHSLLIKHYKSSGKQLPKWLSDYQTTGAKLSYCLFGEHLLPLYPENIVGIVEAPKTAVIGTLYEGLSDNPDNILWLATWAKGYLKKLLPNLKGRNVILFPDASPDNVTYYEWQAIADEVADLHGINVIVSDMLCGIEGKEDIADFLLRKSISVYRRGQQAEQIPEQPPEQVTEQLPEQVTEQLPEQLPEIAALISVLGLEIITGEEIKPFIDFEQEEKQRIKEFWQQYEGLPEQTKPNPEILIVQKMLKAWGGEMDLQQARIELPVRLRQYGIEASADSALQLAVKERYIYKHAFKYSLAG